MGAGIALRQDYDAMKLRDLAKRSNDANQTRRLLALAVIYEGGRRTQAAKSGGVTLQVIRDWVLRFNSEGPAKVLIVDDSPTETYKLTGMLEKSGHQVITASNGEEGVATAKVEIPDLVLMDIVMPGLNGFQATRQLSKAQETSHIPVIIVTTKDQETDRVWGMRQGAKAYLTKPVDEKELYKTMTEVGL